ncbi:MAG: circularly permuted type 2 ATP-grasp protein, partial [Alphaproteobacteria bacterium]
SQTFPDLFRDCRVRRLAGFFQSYRDGVLGLAPAGARRAVLLSPGPYNEAYFEHAFLAHYLGLALVEGEDLSVRDGRVYLKTVGGLERIDVIFRRVDSGYCDPLELRADSALGIPGLVEAVRGGTVAVANALGGAVAESPALAAFLPRLCRALLGDDLLLPGVPTIWCGTAAGRGRVLASLDRLVVRDAFDDRPLFARGSSARVGAELSGAERRQLAERLARRGAGVVAQETTPLAVAPTRDGARLAPRPVALRVFAAWTPGGYVVMPGGLARMAREDGRAALSMQSGAASKDIWVLSDVAAGRSMPHASAGEPMPIRRVGDEAPSRAMDNLLWLGRYAERAESLVRTVRAIILRLGDDAGPEQGITAAGLARRLLVPFAQATEAAAAAADRGEVGPLAAELRDLVLDRAHPQGLRRMLDSVERTAWTVRDRLSVDTWRAILAFAAGDAEEAVGADPAGLRGRLDRLVRRAAALAGLSAENMTRGRNWLFLDFGRRIERGIAMTWVARQLLAAADGDESQTLQHALEIADSAMTYRYRYRGSMHAAPVIDLLLLDATNPRSIAFQAATIAGHVNALPRAAGPRGRDVGDAVDSMQDVLGTADPEALAREVDGRRFGLVALLDFLADAFPRISDAVEDAYFRHSTARRTGSAPRRGG